MSVRSRADSPPTVRFESMVKATGRAQRWWNPVNKKWIKGKKPSVSKAKTTVKANPRWTLEKKDLSPPSRYVGVSWHKRDRKWRAETRVDHQRECLGLYRNEADAACAYDKRAEQLGRPVNFPWKKGQKHALKDGAPRPEKGTLGAMASEFLGVTWNEKAQKWGAAIASATGKSTTNLGLFRHQVEAARKYDEKALALGKTLNFPEDQERKEQEERKAEERRIKAAIPREVRASKYVGVGWSKASQMWKVSLNLKHKAIHLGYFKKDDEMEAARKYDEAAVFYGKPMNFPKKRGQQQAVKGCFGAQYREKRGLPKENVIVEDDEDEEVVEMLVQLVSEHSARKRPAAAARVTRPSAKTAE